MSVAVTNVTSSAPRGMQWEASSPPLLVWYDDGGDANLGLSIGHLFATESPEVEEKPSKTPSEVGDQTDTVSAAIEREFVRLVEQFPEIERIFIRKDEDFMRVWTVVHDVNIEVEDRIYEAQMAFMDKFRDFPCDFSVIFRQDLDLTALKPVDAQVIFSR